MNSNELKLAVVNTVLYTGLVWILTHNPTCSRASVSAVLLNRKVLSVQSVVTTAVTHFFVKRPCNQQKTITASLRRSEYSIPASAGFLITYQVRGFIWRETHSNQFLHYIWLVCQHPNVSDWKCQACSLQFYLINFSFTFVSFIQVLLCCIYCFLIFFLIHWKLISRIYLRIHLSGSLLPPFRLFSPRLLPTSPQCTVLNTPPQFHKVLFFHSYCRYLLRQTVCHVDYTKLL